EGVIAGRGGDPVRAETLLREVLELPDLEARVRWRAELLRAWAAHRAGDDRAAELARGAFDRASALGHPELPLLWERAVTEELLPADGAGADRGDGRAGDGARLVLRRTW